MISDLVVLSRTVFCFMSLKTFGRVMFFLFFFCWEDICFPCFHVFVGHVSTWNRGVFISTITTRTRWRLMPTTEESRLWWLGWKFCCGKLSNEKRAPWLFAVNKGMKHYPVMLELFHKPWNTDPIFKPQIDHLTGAKSCCRSISPRIRYVRRTTAAATSKCAELDETAELAIHKVDHREGTGYGWSGQGPGIWQLQMWRKTHLPCGILSTFSLLYDCPLTFFLRFLLFPPLGNEFIFFPERGTFLSSL